MISVDQVSRLLLRHWDIVGGGYPAPPGFSYVVVTKGSEPGSKIVLLAFPSGDCVPRVAVKLPRSKVQNGSLEIEYENLRTVAPFATHRRIVAPSPLFRGAQDGWVWLAESVIHGVELGSAPESLVALVVDWLVHLGRSTLGVRSASPSADGLPELLARAERHVTTDQEREVLDRAGDRLYRLYSEPLPRVFEQRDMGPWNVLLSRDGTIGVVDWESSCTGGFPAWDLFYFLAHCGFMDRSTEPGERMESFKATFWGRSRFARVARAALRNYSRGLGLRDEWLGPLAAACWLHHAMSEVTRLEIRPSQSLFWHMLTATLERDCELSCLA